MIGPILQSAVILGVFSGLPHLPHMPFRHTKTVHTAADSLPLPWKPSSRLALESQFVRVGLAPLITEPAGLVVQADPRRVEVSFDPDSGTIHTVTQVGEFPLGPGAAVPVSVYEQISSLETFHRQWVQRSIASLSSPANPQNAAAPHPTGLSFQFPSPLPQKIQGLLGPGGPALNVSGSENIKLSGQSNWTNQQLGLQGQKASLFPSLDMQQDLNIRLEGQLSDRIRVNLLQNSLNPIPLTNRIAINYKGDEDDLVQEFDLGNTNLTLPNTQYVSYSGQNEGLFGVKSALRYGPLDFTMLASRQEGRSEHASYAGGGVAGQAQPPIADMDYIPGQYFFLYDPNHERQAIIEGSINVYRDDYNYAVTGNKVQGRAYVDPRSTNDTAYVSGSFSRLVGGADKDYEILNDVYGPDFKVIKLHSRITGDQVLAVTYQYRPYLADGVSLGAVMDMGQQNIGGTNCDNCPMKLIRPPVSSLKPDSLNPAVFDADPRRAPINQTRELELKNFYNLGGQSIDPGSFKLVIERGQVDPPLLNVSHPDGNTVPYIEVLGLDNLDESGSTFIKGHDHRIDGTLVNRASRLFVDYANGILFLPDLRPWAPRLDDAHPFEQAVAAQLFRGDTLDSSRGEQNTPNTAVYDKYNPQRNIDSKYFIDAQFTAQRATGDIYLGRSNIVEGSDVVTINGQPLARDRDYTIDYDLGRVTLKRQLGPSDNLNIDYAYAPLFAQAGRTLVGSAFNLTGRDRRIGGAFLYESRGAQDVRPRIGEEPSRSVISDLNGAIDMKPWWLTRLADRLPGVRTTTPSELHLQAEGGMSFPNPNTQNEVYIDDMEGVRDAVSLTMEPQHWRWSSAPSRKDPNTGTITSVVDSIAPLTTKNAEIHWYTPTHSVKEKDLKPNLTQAQGADNYRTVLAMSLPWRPDSTADLSGRLHHVEDGDSLWAGITYPLDAVGLDISRSQFIELWVNDWRDARVRQHNVRLHIDVGTVSEDQMRAPDAPPNGLLDSEDKRHDRILTEDEDTGYDGHFDADEDPRVLRLRTASATDPQGDDYHGPEEHFKEIDPRRYKYTNGTEGNRLLNPNPDTEDLNNNDHLDTQEAYFEYTVRLAEGDTTYLATDVYRDYPGVASDNGWRRYRIPLNDARAVSFGNPNLTLAKHVRVWVDGADSVEVDPNTLSDPYAIILPYLVLGSLDIVGSRWQSTALDSTATALGATQTLNAVNSLDNADIYAPPFQPGQTRSGNQEVTRREQSIALEFTGLPPRGSLEAFKTFSLDEDYSRYANLRWYVAAYDVRGAAVHDSLRYFVRFASDEVGQNYYEYSATLPRFSPERDPVQLVWDAATLRLTDISNLKLTKGYTDPINAPFVYAVPGTSIRYAILGRPSFTRIRRISFGLVNGDTTLTWDRGQLWFDEVRSTDISKDVDKAGRLMVTGNWANLMRYNASFDGRGADFVTVGQTRGTGNSTRAVQLGAQFDLHRFFEGTGIQLPASFNYSDNSSKPRFTAGDDVVRTGALAEASESRAINRAWTLNYSRVWTDRSNPFLRFWLNGLNGSVNGSSGSARSPNAIGAQQSFGATVNYGITPRRYMPLRVPLTRFRLYPLPERAWWNYAVGTTHSTSVQRLPDGTLAGTVSDIIGRTAGIDCGADSRWIDALHHHIEAHRNLTLPLPLLERVGPVNFGRVVAWRQATDISYTLARGAWIRPTLSWSSSYAQNNGPELSPDLSVRSIGNGQTVRGNWDFPFDRLVAAPGRADSGRAGPPMWRRAGSHLGTISADAQFNQSSAYSRMTGTPSFVYLFGFSRDPGLEDGRVAPAFNNQSARSEDWRAAVRSRLALIYGSFASVRGEWSARNQNTNGVANRTAALDFPNLELDYGRVAHAVRLDRFLRNPQLRTTYDRTRQTEYQLNSTTPSTIRTGTNWRPLLGVSGDLRNGAHADLQLERSTTQELNQVLGSSLKTTRNTNLRLSLSRSYTQGQKVNFLGKETVVKSTVSLGATGTYSRNSSETRLLDSGGGATGITQPTDSDRLAVNGTGSYGFSNNVTGNVTLGYGQDRDLVAKIVHRNVIVELRASFTF